MKRMRVKPRRELGWLIAALLFGAVPATADAERLSLPEVKLAAGARFDKLDHDADGTLDPGELRGVIGRSATERSSQKRAAIRRLGASRTGEAA